MVKFKSHGESTAGELVNLMSVDAQRVMRVMTFINNFWSSPLRIGVALYLLYNTLGISVLAGIGVVLLALPLFGVFSSRMFALQVTLHSLFCYYCYRAMRYVATPRLRGYTATQLHCYAATRLHGYATPQLHGDAAAWLLGYERFQASRRDDGIRRLMTHWFVNISCLAWDQASSLVGWIGERSEPSGGLRRGERRRDYCPDWRFARLWPLAFFPFCGAWAGPRLSFVNFNQNNWNSWWEGLLLKPAFLIIMVKKRQGVIFAVLDYGHERQLMFMFSFAGWAND